MEPIVILALYKFVRLDDYAAMRAPLLDFMIAHEIRGTLLLAGEGINGTAAGSRASIDALLEKLRADPRLADLDSKESYNTSNPFQRTKVRIKREIVTMGIDGIDPLQSAGTYIAPSDWNALISDPETVLIDTRNEYEIGIGTFQNSVNPHIASFREFPDYVEQNLDPEKHRKVAMFCTGGIRCEKSTAFLKERGFEEVYHLKGGILKYLEEVPVEESLWDGECFVFDDRVAVGHSLEKGAYDQCHACRMPITAADQRSEYFEAGVSCPFCHADHSPERRARHQERERQIRLARSRNEVHIGDGAEQTARKRRQMKLRSKEAASRKHGI